MENSIVFDLFRYQIIPMASTFQLNLLESLQDTIKKKNQYFAETLENVEFQSAGKPLLKNLSNLLADVYVLKLGRTKHVKIYKQDFAPEHVPSHPPTVVFIDNTPHKQIIAIEQNNLFSSTSTLANLIAKHINIFLKKKNLVVKILPIFEEKSFWQFVDEHKGGIKNIEFTLITPNMSNISKMLSEDLKKTAQLSKTAETRLKLLSEKNSILEVNKDNSGMASLVDYASEGGGRILIKGLVAKYDSKKNQKTFSFDSFEADTPEGVQIIRELINGKID